MQHIVIQSYIKLSYKMKMIYIPKSVKKNTKTYLSVSKTWNASKKPHNIWDAVLVVW